MARTCRANEALPLIPCSTRRQATDMLLLLRQPSASAIRPDLCLSPFSHGRIAARASRDGRWPRSPCRPGVSAAAGRAIRHPRPDGAPTGGSSPRKRPTPTAARGRPWTGDCPVFAPDPRRRTADMPISRPARRPRTPRAHARSRPNRAGQPGATCSVRRRTRATSWRRDCWASAAMTANALTKPNRCRATPERLR